jgi:hypothetical protein
LLWTQVPVRGSHWVRIAERRTWLSIDYGVEAIYCELIELATHATYGYEDTSTSAWITASSVDTISAISHVRIAKESGDGSYIVEISRYQEFTTRALDVAHSCIQFVQIAGNKNILISVLSDHSFRSPVGVQVVRSDAIPSEPRKSRSALFCRVSELTGTLLALEKQGVAIEHIYDF